MASDIERVCDNVVFFFLQESKYLYKHEFRGKRIQGTD